MILVIGVASGLIIANKLIGIYMQADFIEQEINEELKIVK